MSVRSEVAGEVQSFRYERPEVTTGKRFTLLARTDIALCGVQVVREGGENKLHSHSHLDGVWYVLSGTARFYTRDDVVIGEFGPGEGILTPRGYFYWFESAGDEPLELLQFQASDKAMASLDDAKADRVEE